LAISLYMYIKTNYECLITNYDIWLCALVLRRPRSFKIRITFPNFFHFFLIHFKQIENIFQKSGSTLASRYICTIKTNYELPITNYAWQYRIQFIAILPESEQSLNPSKMDCPSQQERGKG
jgi:hypothetical protein